MKGGATGGVGGLGGGGSSYAFPAKRRWRGLVVGVLGLVILSMLVPLVFCSAFTAAFTLLVLLLNNRVRLQ
ncbi:hypothetical protein FNV43_RR09866 [Rhamnella rubrinervis]|uniref:Uncharacterized protein n=1 Tax=Rhamnella rubrinervis TaxID=2594499 RepID=A0A8K0HBI7_9ROSA|nr:hypothetical protein FNV43_RR09866 [Rhamnella rubrinervis]